MVVQETAVIGMVTRDTTSDSNQGTRTERFFIQEIRTGICRQPAAGDKDVTYKRQNIKIKVRIKDKVRGTVRDKMRDKLECKIKDKMRYKARDKVTDRRQ